MSEAYTFIILTVSFTEQLKNIYIYFAFGSHFNLEGLWSDNAFSDKSMYTEANKKWTNSNVL